MLDKLNEFPSDISDFLNFFVCYTCSLFSLYSYYTFYDDMFITRAHLRQKIQVLHTNKRILLLWLRSTNLYTCSLYSLYAYFIVYVCHMDNQGPFDAENSNFTCKQRKFEFQLNHQLLFIKICKKIQSLLKIFQIFFVLVASIYAQCQIQSLNMSLESIWT